MAAALAVGGLLMLVVGLRERRQPGHGEIGMRTACWMGAVQGLVLPFRGLSRSGSTISVALAGGAERARAEEFSFALAVLLTPLAILWELRRLVEQRHAFHDGITLGLFIPDLVGAVAACCCGLFALRWLSNWLEQGLWYLFGIYCLGASLVVTITMVAGLVSRPARRPMAPGRGT